MDLKHERWTERLDRFCLGCAVFLPTAIVMGNIVFELAVGLAGAGWILRCVLAGENPFSTLRHNILFLPWLAWFLAILLSLAVNGAGSKGWGHDIIFLRYPLFGAALIDVSTRKPVARWLAWGLAAGVAWAALNTAVAYLWGHDFLFKPWKQYMSKLKIAARMAGLTAYAVPFFVTGGLFGGGGRKRRNLFFALAGAAFVLLLMMHLRTMILACVAGLCFGVGYCVYRQRTHRWALALVLVMGIMASGSFFYFKGMTSFANVYDRVYFWKVAWQMWQDHPVFGVSVSAYQDEYYATAVSGKVTPFAAPNGIVYAQKRTMHAHNLPLMLLSSTGLLGLAAFAWLFVRASMAVTRFPGTRRAGLVTWPVVLLVIGLTGANIYHSWYQALLAFFLVYIAADDRPGGRVQSPAGAGAE